MKRLTATMQATAVVVLLCAAIGAGAAEPAGTAPAAKPAALPAEPDEATRREMREAVIKVQKRLRAEQRAREQAQRTDAKNERCIGGQRMRRVENGWVDAGAC